MYNKVTTVKCLPRKNATITNNIINDITPNNDIINDITTIGNCSNKSVYGYTEEQVKYIFESIEKTLAKSI